MALSVIEVLRSCLWVAAPLFSIQSEPLSVSACGSRCFCDWGALISLTTTDRPRYDAVCIFPCNNECPHSAIARVVARSLDANFVACFGMFCPPLHTATPPYHPMPRSSRWQVQYSSDTVYVVLFKSLSVFRSGRFLRVISLFGLENREGKSHSDPACLASESSFDAARRNGRADRTLTLALRTLLLCCSLRRAEGGCGIYP